MLLALPGRLRFIALCVIRRKIGGIGGIGGIAPSRMSEVAGLGVRAMIGGTLAAFMTATIAGVLL